MFEKPLPEWLAAGVKPPQEIINDGYTPGYKPPAEWENWLRNATYEAMKEMRTQLENATPSGMIVMWSGTYANIPTGWHLCDGSNGTPDLTDRFILGATSESDIGDTGGQHEVTLTVDQMPSHSHSGTANSAGGHIHNIEAYRSGTWSGQMVQRGNNTDRDDGVTQQAGNHTHSLSINSTGGSQPHENRPAFYKLAFIMKE